MKAPKNSRWFALPENSGNIKIQETLAKCDFFGYTYVIKEVKRMKKLVVLFITLFFAISMMPVLAAEKTDSASKKDTDKSPSFFQQASDDISQITLTASDKSPVEIFQETSNDIKAGCPEARSDTLRGHKSELKRRMVGKNIIFT